MQASKSSHEIVNARVGRFAQRIGSTTYRVSMHFPQKEDESLETKILRMMRNDLNRQSDGGIIMSLQTGRLPGGSA